MSVPRELLIRISRISEVKNTIFLETYSTFRSQIFARSNHAIGISAKSTLSLCGIFSRTTRRVLAWKLQRHLATNDFQTFKILRLQFDSALQEITKQFIVARTPMGGNIT